MSVNLASFSKEAKALALSLTPPCCGPFSSGWHRGDTQHCPLCHSCSNLQQRAASGLSVQQLSRSLHGCRLLKGAAKCQGFYLCDLPPLCRPELMHRNVVKIMETSTQTHTGTSALFHSDRGFIFRTYVHFWWLCTCLHAVSFYLLLTQRAPWSTQGDSTVFIPSSTLGCCFVVASHLVTVPMESHWFLGAVLPLLFCRWTRQGAGLQPVPITPGE